MKRPMLCWVCLFVLGEVLSITVPINVIGLMIFGLSFVLYKCVCKNDNVKKNRTLYLIGIFSFILGVVCMMNVQRTIRECNQLIGKKISFEGRVTNVETSSRGDTYLVNGNGMKIKITLKENKDLVPGERIKGTGIGKGFSKATNPGEYDEQAYQFGRGVFLSLQEVKICDRNVPKFSIYAELYRLSNYLQSIYGSLFEEKEASLAGDGIGS